MTDHAAMADNALLRADMQGAADQLGDNLRMEALVHATLAVAEQQRIANLIALGNGYTREFDVDWATDDEKARLIELNARQRTILEALGLPVPVA